MAGRHPGLEATRSDCGHKRSQISNAYQVRIVEFAENCRRVCCGCSCWLLVGPPLAARWAA